MRGGDRLRLRERGAQQQGEDEGGGFQAAFHAAVRLRDAMFDARGGRGVAMTNGRGDAWGEAGRATMALAGPVAQCRKAGMTAAADRPRKRVATDRRRRR
ncbi:hypothetical protein MASR1M8_07050 [Thermomonas brevis]